MSVMDAVPWSLYYSYSILKVDLTMISLLTFSFPDIFFSWQHYFSRIWDETCVFDCDWSEDRNILYSVNLELEGSRLSYDLLQWCCGQIWRLRLLFSHAVLLQRKEQIEKVDTFFELVNVDLSLPVLTKDAICCNAMLQQYCGQIWRLRPLFSHAVLLQAGRPHRKRANSNIDSARMDLSICLFCSCWQSWQELTRWVEVTRVFVQLASSVAVRRRKVLVCSSWWK